MRFTSSGTSQITSPVSSLAHRLRSFFGIQKIVQGFALLLILAGGLWFSGLQNFQDTYAQTTSGEEWLCYDGLDNDNDGLSDCEDPDCNSYKSCQENGQGPENNCTDGGDDDNDGFKDCNDRDCVELYECAFGQEENNYSCEDGQDNDFDGDVDCDDSDCAGFGGCPAGGGGGSCSTGTYYLDADGDGYGGSSPSMQSCGAPILFWGSGANGAVNALAQDGSGKTIIGGIFTAYNGTTRTRLARINVDGTLDTTFPDTLVNGAVNAIVIQADGKIVIGGAFTSVASTTRNRIARLNSNGTLDTGYNPNMGGTVWSLALDRAGKVIVGGDFTTIAGTSGAGRTRIARLLTTGAVDTTWLPTGPNSTVYALAVQTDGKIVIGGNFTTAGGSARNYLARYNTNATLDTTYNPSANTTVWSMALQGTKLIVGGNFTAIGSGAGGVITPRLGRLNTDGTLDVTFGNSAANGVVKSVALDGSGNIYVGGDFTTLGGANMSRLGRVLVNGGVDTSFPNMVVNSTVNGIRVRTDGSVIFGGAFTQVNSQSRGYVSVVSSAGQLAVNQSYVTTNTDCNDTNASINPGAVELDDGIDQNCVNDAPFIDIMTESIFSINEDSTGSVLFGIGDVDNTLSCTNTSHVAFTSSNNTLISVGNIIRGMQSGKCSLTLTPTANAYGTATIQIILNDGVQNVAQSYVQTVNSINDAPSGTDRVLITPINTEYFFAINDLVNNTFIYTESNDSPINALSGVKITSLPTVGTLTRLTPVLTGQIIKYTDIIWMQWLMYTPPANISGLNAGSFTFQLQDDGGTTSGGVDIDPTPNTVTVHITSYTINSGATATNSTGVQINNIICPAGSQIAYSHSDTYPTNRTPCTSTLSYTFPTGDGTKYFYMRWKDADGNESESLERTINLDATAPVGGSFTINSNAAYTSGTSVTLNTTCGTDVGVGGVQVAFGNSANPTNWTTCTASSAHTLSVGDGTKTVYMRFRDSLGNISSDVTDQIVFDMTAPTQSWMITEPSFTSGTSNSVASTNSTDAGVGGVQYEFCRNTAVTSVGCTSSGWGVATGATFGGLNDGQLYYYFVRSRDSLGNIGSWSSVTTSTQDNAVPTTSFSANTATCSAGNITVTLTCSDGSGAGCATREYKVVDQAVSCDASGLSTYSAPFAISGVGSKKVCYRSTDAVGNVQAIQTSAVYTITPAVTITKVPNTNTLTCTIAGVALTASGASTYVWSNGATTAGITANTAGTYTVTGTYNGCTISASETITATSSIVTITTGSKTDPSGCNLTNGSISVSATTTNGTIQYSLDNTNRQAGGTFTNLGAGTYTVYVRDGTNALCATNQMSFNLSNPLSPTVFITSSVEPLTCNAGSTTLTANGASSYLWSNGATTSTISMSGTGVYSVTGTTAGCNGVGNFTVTATQNVTTINTVTPTNPTTCGGANGTITINASTSNGTAQYSLNGTTWQTSNIFTGLSAGTYTPRVRNGTAQYCDLVVGSPVTLTDPSTPQILTATPTNPATCGGNGSLALTFTNVPNGTYTITYSGGSFTNVNVTSNAATISTPAGNFTNLQITTNGTCVNTGIINALFDTTAPSAPTMTAEPTFTQGLSNVVSSTVSTDAGVKCVQYEFCRNTTNSTAGCTSSGWTGTNSHTFSSLSDGQIYYYFVRSRDSLNNIGVWSASTNSTQDNTAPVGGSFTINSNAAYTSGTSVILNTTCGTDAGVGGVEVAFGNTANPTNWTTCTASSAHTLTVGDGTKTVYMRFRDSLGNMSTDTTDTIVLDQTAPIVPTITAEPTYTVGTNNTVVSTVVTDAGIGGVQYEFCSNTTNSTSGCTSSGWGTATGVTLSSLSDGQIYYYFVRSKDSLNNISAWSTSTNSTQDNAAPTTTLSPNGASCHTGIALTLSCLDGSGAGCTSIQYKIVESTSSCDTTGLLTYTGTFTVPSTSTKKVCYRSLDAVGNTETIQTSALFEATATIFYQDSDGDGYGNAGVTQTACTLPGGYTTNSTDCLDTDARVNPTTIWYSDDDADGFSDGVIQTACTDPGATWYMSHQLIGTANTAYSLNLTSGLVGHWSFDGANGIDDSGNGNTGTTVGGMGFTGGKVGKAGQFDGVDDYVGIQNIHPGNDLTMSAWIFWQGGGGDHNIVTKESAYEFRVNGGYINFATNPWDWKGGNSSQISENVWTHVSITHDDNGLQKIYINGIETYSGNSSGPITNTSEIVTIASRGGGTWNFFNGGIDDVRIYNRALSSIEIQKLYTLTDKAQAGDCLDTNGSRHPLSAEVCDGVDNDCDGSIDEGVTNTYYQDNDGDGYGNAGVTQTACTVPGGYVTNSTDCLDTDARVNPTTIRYSDDDADGFSDGVTQTVCTDPGATWYQSYQLIGTANTAYSLNLTSGLVGHWSFDGANGNDESGNGNIGTIVGGVGFTGGKVGKAGQFDGVDDYVVINSGVDFDEESVITLSLWIKPDTVFGNQYVIELPEGSNGTNGPGIQILGGNVYFHMVTHNASDFTSVYSGISSNQFSHLVLTYDGNVLKGFKDGNLVGSANVSLGIGIKHFSQEVNIGRFGNFGAFFNGTIDDLRIYNRALSPGEVQKLYTLTDKLQAGDCLDTNGTRHPLAVEICDGIDNDCDGIADEGTTSTYYADSDGDTYGNAAVTTGGAGICSAPLGYTGDNTDCVDTDAIQKPGQVWWLDADNDDYGSATTGSMTQCLRPTNRYIAAELTATGSDCNDASASVNPGAVEIAVNGVDNNCDELEICYRDVDNDTYGSTNTTGSAILSCVGTGIANNATDCVDTDALQKPGQFWWTDGDGDGVGLGTGVTQCTRPLSGFVTTELTLTGVDCNDTNALNFPGNTEVCDLQDNDCDTLIDDADPDFVGGGTYYQDSDGDGYGNPSVTINACGATTGYVVDNTDCNDTDLLEKPGQVWYKDADNDAFGDASSSSITQCLRPVNYKVAAQLTGGTNNDCNDASAITYPGATELNDGLDQNCVNDAPTLSAITNKTINEDTTTGVNYTLTDVDNVLSCTSTTGITYTSTNTTLLPVANITRGGTTPNCSITVAPVANLFGTSNIQIVVNDGLLNNAQTFMLTVNSVNDAPSGTGSTIFMAQNSIFTFSTGNFVITDSLDNPSNALNRVKITTLPTTGALSLNSGAVSVGQFITLADITNGLLRYTPAVNGVGLAYTTFTIQPEDNGGTGNGGVNLDPTPRTITVDVVNFAIDSGAAATNTTSVTLNNITCPVGSDIAFGNTTNPTNRQTCAASKSHTLTAGDGTKTVYMRWRVGSLISANLTKTILLDTTAPTGGTFTINFDDAATNITGVNLGTTCATDGSGVGGVQVAYGTGTTPTNWTSCLGNVAIGYTLTPPDGTKTLYIRFRDSLGNTSSAVSDAILLDQTAPSGASMSAEPTYTSGLINTVTRTNANDGAGVGGITYQFCRNTTNTTASGCVLSSWTGASTMTYTGLVDGQIYYYFVRARDSLTNTSTWSASTNSTQDNTAPSGGSFTINNDALGTNTTAVTLNTVCPTDAVSSGVQVAYGTGATPSNWTGCSASIPFTLPSGDGTKTIYMQFRDAVQNTTTILSDTIILDTIAPTGGSFVINNDAIATSGIQVTLNTICATDAGVGGVQVAYGDANGPTNWTGCSANIPYTLPIGDGGKNVLMRWKDAVGNVTVTHAVDGIHLDTHVPDVPLMSAEPTFTSGTQNTVQGNFQSDMGIGPREMQFCINTGNTTVGCTPNAWRERTLNTVTYTGLVDGQTYFYFVRARDAAGNISARSTGAFSTQDASPPVGGSFVINNNASGTNTQSVTLNITCGVDAGIGSVDVAYGNTSGATNRTSCFGTIAHTLSAGDGEKTVYVRFRDTLYNQTSDITDTIFLDTTAPTVSIMNAEPAYTSGLTNTVSSTTSTDAGIGGVEYQYCRTTSSFVNLCTLSGRLPSPAYTFTSLTNNVLYYYFVQTRDSLGNTSAWSTGTSSRQDNVAPSGATMVAEPAYTAGTTNTVYSNTATDAGAGNIQYQFCINTGNTTTGCTPSSWSSATGTTFSGLVEGTLYYYFVRAKDGVENTSARSSSTNSRHDTTAPNTTLIPNGSTCMTGSTSVTIACTDTGGAGCLNSEYKIIDGASSCDATGLTTYSGAIILSGSGLKKICYRSTDNVSNVQTIQTSANFTISDTVYYQDSDGDGYGNAAISQIACSTPVGYTGDNTDCVDTDAIQKPGQTWYKDADDDDYGDASTGSLTQCTRPTDYKAAVELTATNTDCNDTLATTYPGATEFPDGIDQNCVNDSPTMSAISPTTQTTNEDVLKIVGLTIQDVDNILNCSGSVSLTSSNSALITPANIAKSGTPPACTLTLYPIANQYGTSAISVSVSDGLLNTGRNFTFSVTSVNDAPSGIDNTVMAFENTPYVFGTGDFPFTDVNDNPTNALSSVIIQSVPGGGVLRNNGLTISAGGSVSVSDLNSGNVIYTPTAGASGSANYASFGFRVVDNGGTANGGVSADQSANTLSISLLGFAINSGATATATTGVTLTNIVCPAGSDIARGNATNPTNWTACTASKAHTLTSGDGTKTVYMRRRNASGTISSNFTKTILLDTTAPVGGNFTINNNTTGTNTSGVTLNTTCATDAGVGGVQVAYGNASNPNNWTTCAATINHVLTGSDGVKTVYMLFKDSLNNTTTTITDTIILDTTAPTTTITPNGATCATGSTLVSLSCNDGTGIGCASIEYKIVNNGTTCDTSNLITYTGAFMMNGVGVRKVCYRSSDAANNTQSIQTSATYTVSNTTYYQDSDGDGFGNPSVTQISCGAPVGYTGDNTDCVDTDPKQKPGQVWWKDADNDNYGDASTGSLTQCLRPVNYKISTEMTLTGMDCNDTAFAINPGVTDIVANGIDDDCDGFETCYVDADFDSHGTTTTTGTTNLSCLASGVSLLSDDCNDLVSTIYPGALDICDGMDNSCNSIIDEKPDGSICTICERIDLTIPQYECESLRAMYTGSNGSGWNNNTNWLTSVDVESWYGVGLLSGHVDTLTLSDNNLVGTLGTGLRLPLLSSLDISDNQGLAINSVGQLTGLSVLNIANMDLNALPTSIGLLQTLDVLYANNNLLTDIVATVSQLNDLNILDLSNNALTALGTQLQNKAQLTLLDLSDNQIIVVNALAFSGVGALQELNFARNLLNAIPANITSTTSTLQHVSFADNDITTLPTASFFNQFGALRTLNLSGNTLTTLGSISNLTNLTTLDVRGNQLTQMPGGIAGLSSLDHVIINDNLLTTGLTLLAQITGLQTLYAQNNDFSGLIPQSFDQMNSLGVLSLQNNNLDRENTFEAKSSHLNTTRWNRLGFAKDVSNQGDVTAPTLLGTGTVDPLSILFIEYNFAWSENSFAVTTGGAGMSMVYSGGGLCPYLTSDPILTGVSAATIAISSTTGGNYSGCTAQLRDHANNFSAPVTLPTFFLSVNLSDMCLHPSLTIPASECMVLVELFSGTNGMSWTNRAGWFKTANVENWFGIRTASGSVGDPLRHVDGIFLQKSSGVDENGLVSAWNGNNLVGRLPATLGNLPYLKEFNVSRNTISGTLPNSITQLTGLEQVWIRNNQLSGPLPSNWSAITTLKVFDANTNQFTGTIPASMLTSTGLQRIDLGSNQLTGTIPTTFGALKNMTALVLGNNQLQGTIPTELGNATGLQFLDLRNNRLVGTVPNSFVQLTGIIGTTNKGFYIDGNALNRNIGPNHEAILTPSVDAWFTILTNKQRNNQKDITPPVISGTGTVPVVIPTSGTISYSLTVNENSYPVNNLGNGMQTVFGPVGTCSTLSGTRIMVNTGTTTLTIQPIQPGVYENCTLQIRDHGNNLSNSIQLPLFTYGLGAASICFDTGLNISSTECLQLSQLYTNTNGSGWINKTNWFSNTDVETWFGINLTATGTPLKKVKEIVLHRNDVTDSDDRSDPTTSGNNLSGTLSVNWSVFTALETLRLDDNKIGGVLPVSLASLTGLQILTLSNNQFIGTLPQNWSGLVAVQTLSVAGNQLVGSLPSEWSSLSNLYALDISNNAFTALMQSGGVFTNLEIFDASYNLLTGTLPGVIATWPIVESVNLSNNTYSGPLPDSWSVMTNITTLNISNNQLTGTLPTSWSSMAGLQTVDMSNNMLGGGIPTEWANRSVLKSFVMRNNQLGGDLGTGITAWTQLTTLDLANNEFVGFISDELNSLTALQTLYLQGNNFNRTNTHQAVISNALSSWYAGLQNKDISNQGDITVPNIQSSTVIVSPVVGNITYNAQISENSYAVSTGGQSMLLSVTGSTNCNSLFITPNTISISSGVVQLILSPSVNGYYSCSLVLTDHAGNRGVRPLTPFQYNSLCGNGILNASESCDEGKQCDDGRSCTTNPGLCPTECRPRMVNNCNPSCQASICGDRYVDPDGIDANPTSTYDDETCDEGRYCNNGTDCTNDPSICGPGNIGLFECKPRALNGCSPSCTLQTCGDGFVDMNGPDNIIGTIDDEACDDTNLNPGDGCSPTCKKEYCGDGYKDNNGPNNDGVGSEECDLGPNNGVLGGLCTSDCKYPSNVCAFCFENCDGGTGQHSIFLLIDRSGSMNENNRLANAKTGAINFINLVQSGAAINTGFITNIGLITFSDSATVVVPPTTNYNSVKTAINNITAQGATNFGSAIQAARQYFLTNPPPGTYKKHLILLSDGMPTVGGPDPYSDPGVWAIYNAQQAKAANINMYTIAIDLDDEGLEYMANMSSSTKINKAWGRSAAQVSTEGGSSSYAATRATDALKNTFSLTEEEYLPWWQTDMNSTITIEKLNVWNRETQTTETADAWVFVSTTPFATGATLSGLLADGNIKKAFITGAVSRPTILGPQAFGLATGSALLGQYVRVQLTNQAPNIPSLITPASLTGKKIWLDGQDVDGDGLANDNPNDWSTISSWTDKSGLGNNPTLQGTVRYRNYQGDQGVYIPNSAGMLLNNSTMNTGAIYMVVKKPSGYDSNGTIVQAQSLEGDSFDSTDPNGPSANYSHNTNWTKTYCPTNSAQKLTITFSRFRTQDSSDYLRVYNGNNTSAPLISTWFGNRNNTSSLNAMTYTATSVNGCITLQFITNNSGTLREGWEAVLTTPQQLDGSQFYIGSLGNNSQALRLGTTPNLAGSSSNNTTLHIYGIVKTPTTYLFTDNGVVVGSGSSPSSFANVVWGTNTAVGASNGSDHIISEYLQFDRALSVAEQQAIQGYLSHKRGQSNSLPTDHPYYAPVNNTNLGVAELEVIGCDASDATCTDKFHYKDYGGITLKTLYGHVFGSIHCDCDPVRLCDATCGDKVVTDTEQCDYDSYCDDWNGVGGTLCTTDPTICSSQNKGQCKPRMQNGCTDTCQFTSCGDKIVEYVSQSCVQTNNFTGSVCLTKSDCAPNEYCAAIAMTGNYVVERQCLNAVELSTCSMPATESCDDGNTALGDGCNASCQLEYCGDGHVDNDGPDNIFATSDDEECDDGNSDSGDGCTATCRTENKCGDGVIDADGADNQVGTNDDEMCDEGSRCDEAATVSCNSSAQCVALGYPANSCKPRLKNGCTPNCNYGFCGDSIIDVDGNDNLVPTEDDEECDPGMVCPNGVIGCFETPSLCPGQCEPRRTPDCTAQCLLTFCGDGYYDFDGADNIQGTVDDEECDDANSNDIDLCDNSCQLTNITFCPAEYLTQCDTGFDITYMTGQGWFCLQTQLTGATQISYTITWNGDGGTSPSPTTVLHGDQIGTLPVTTWSGYIFSGRYTETGFEQILPSRVITSDETYYAKWRN